ncbi:MAG TPA: glycosyl hydrolase [Solirubrobacteraceae bacterium]|jgi:beta-mannanase|nr:glycosyl hydrolase [Solirubrobacteraceae bacterium]
MRRATVAPLVLFVLLAAFVAQQHGLIVRSTTTNAAPYPVSPVAARALGVGATTAALAQNSYRPWRAGDLTTVNALEQSVRRHMSIVMWYADWQHSQLRASQLDAVARHGSVPEITWEPWDSTKPLYFPQPRYALRHIIAGDFDSYIRSWAKGLAAWGHPVLLRLAQEMNGNWYPWGRTANGNLPGQFVQMWRHVHHIFDLAGATNVRWVWSPVMGAPRSYFPGRGQVNVLGLTCLNEGSLGRGWRSFETICGKSIAQLHAMAPGLPIQSSETGSTELGGSKASWISEMFGYLARHSEVQSVVWFNLRKKSVDWRVQSSRSAERAFARGSRLPRSG